MIDINELMSMAESLPMDIKTQLIDRLLCSLNPSQKEIDELWAKEAERRLAEVRAGKVKTVPGEKVFNEIRQRLSK